MIRRNPPPAFSALIGVALSLLAIALPSGAGPLLPDLQGNNLTVPKGTKNWDSTFTLSARIWNSGKADAGPFEVGWFLSKDSTGSSDDLPLSLSNGAAAFLKDDAVNLAHTRASDASLQPARNGVSPFLAGDLFMKASPS